MVHRAATVTLFGALLLAGAPSLTAHDRIQLRVNPAISREPAIVNVKAVVERHPANRELEIVAESDQFFRSSTINLEGDNAPLVTEISLKNLPGGDYQISAVLVDDQGRRTVARSSVIVVPTLASELRH
jgi:hypothetical protein